MDLATIGTGIGLLLASGWGAWERTRAENAKAKAEASKVLAIAAKAEAETAKMEAGESRANSALKTVYEDRVKELEAQIQAQRDRHERQDKESRDRLEKAEEEWAKRYDANRDFHHEQAKKSQALLFECQDKCARLESLTNLAPILDHIKRQDALLTERSRVDGDLFKVIRELKDAVGQLTAQLCRAPVSRDSVDGPG